MLVSSTTSLNRWRTVKSRCSASSTMACYNNWQDYQSLVVLLCPCPSLTTQLLLSNLTLSNLLVQTQECCPHRKVSLSHVATNTLSKVSAKRKRSAVAVGTKSVVSSVFAMMGVTSVLIVVCSLPISLSQVEVVARTARTIRASG